MSASSILRLVQCYISLVCMSSLTYSFDSDRLSLSSTTMSDWFGTPEKQRATATPTQSTPKISLPSTSALPDRPIRTAAMQDELRQERKRRKKERKQHNQVPSTSSISTYINKSGDTIQSTKNGPSTASEGRFRLKEARMREEEKIRNMSAGISTPVSLPLVYHLDISTIHSQSNI